MAEQSTRSDRHSTKIIYDQLFHSGLGPSKLKDAVIGGRFFQISQDTIGVSGRSLVWKLFLLRDEPLEPRTDQPPVPPVESLRIHRKQYSELLMEKMRAPDGSYDDSFVVPGLSIPRKNLQFAINLDRNNPLSLDNDNPWKEWFAAVDLRKTIQQDVERTFPELDYFRDEDVQQQLSNILFLYATMHPDIGYRQGMHELLAPLYYAIDYDSTAEDTISPIEDSAFSEMCSRIWVAADSWALFSSLMKRISQWYEWRETSVPAVSSPHGQINLQPYVSPIVQACGHIQGTLLKCVDPSLYAAMQTAGVEPQIYGLRWLRLLFTREFSMDDAMVLWDGIFACAFPVAEVAQWLCVAMLIRIRTKLISSDFSGQLTYLLRYPPCPTPEQRTPHHAVVLLQQATALRTAPTPSTGAALMIENRNLLGIPLEVPDVPTPSRQRSGLQQRGHPSSGYNAHTQGSVPVRQPHQIGLPELISRGLLDRGEMLGINKTVMNAVSELKRNLPELAASLVRTPSSAPASYAAYPLRDEKAPEEGPAWDHRNRFEVDREISELRQTNKRLGDSVTSILEILRQDEEKAEDREQLRLRKSQALDALSFVKDVLQGAVPDIEEQTLFGEENRTREPRPESSGQNVPAYRSTPRTISRPIAASKSSSDARNTKNLFGSLLRDARQSSSGTMFAPMSSNGFVRLPSSPSSSSSISTPNVTSTSLSSLSHTRSQSSSLPARSNAALCTPPRMAASPFSQLPDGETHGVFRPGTGAPGDQSPKVQNEIQHDPLGVLR
ncbi:rab-GTPase-TBC domain-containing protein [Hygrophoropsis aurantiaca]|uniref:Rab-GTPase-TBC domain-containing protein n=1 Tax=Hygrophoropsis aurantiaca TaxID=72124 RepID=A0ACB8ABS1_9AGAM|nr:rab-GTPase-TBC domain-containing protein [Hygrophoropsis aurantiaca]